jgi:hypothetical protein
MRTLPRFGRRSVLAASAGALLTSPWWRLSRVLAGEQAAPKRLVIWHIPSGTVEAEWRPTAGPTESDFTLGRILSPLERHRDKLLIVGPSDPGDPTSPTYHWRERKGVSIWIDDGEGHVLTKMLTGTSSSDFDGIRWANGVSVDQAVAARIGMDSPFRSIELGTHDVWAGSSPSSRMCYSAPGVPVPPEHNPAATFERVFGGFSVTPDPAIERRRLRRRALLDFGQGEIRGARAALGTEEQRTFDAHAESLAELQRRIAAVEAATCSPPDMSPPEYMAPSYDVRPQGFMEAQVDLAAHALGCDLTRVVSFSFGRSDSHLRLPWLGGLAESMTHHGLSHTNPGDIVPGVNEQGYAQLHAFIDVHEWYSEQLARFMDLLDAMPEGDGTVLDHTLIFCCSELSEGQFHTEQNMPFMLAGGASDYFRMGRYVQYDDKPHNELLLSIAHAMGLEDLETFGDRELCSGPLPGLV